MFTKTWLLFPSLVILAFAATLSVAQNCVSIYDQNCVNKGEAGFPSGFESFLSNDGPCFNFNGEDVCFLGSGTSLNPCKCSVASCKCPSSSGEPQPTCSSTFETPDCSSQKQTYCQLHQSNSACLYCGMSSSNCGQHCLNGISSAEQQTILDEHNKWRSLVANGQENRSTVAGVSQPSAANMVKLVWDDELQLVAQAFADQCIFGHDQDRQIPSHPGKAVGQNVAISFSPVLNSNKGLADAIERWYDEVASFPAGNVAPWSTAGATGVTGHYTQVVWAETERVGCGYIKYKKSSTYDELLICNYYPSGNFASGNVYTVGPAASACPSAHPIAENGLCTK